MSKALSMAELEAEQIELLPARTQMCGWGGSSVGIGGHGGNGGLINVNALNIDVAGQQVNSAGNGGAGGPGFGN